MKYQRTPAEQKAEILELVRKSPVSVRETLVEMGLPKSTYYRWLRRKEEGGLQALKDRKTRPQSIWNRIREEEEIHVLNLAKQHTDYAARQLALMITDEGRFSISESTVFRILKREDLIVPIIVEREGAADEFHTKTRRVNEMWQTDLTYFFISGWGWYYLGGVLDDFSRYLICFEVKQDMKGTTLSDLVQKAIEITGVEDVPVEHKPKLLSDNGSGYISGVFEEYLEVMQIKHIRSSRCHPQTCGKIERMHRTAKERMKLILYTTPTQLQEAAREFQRWYNEERYHEAISNLRPIDVWLGKGEQILARRKELKRRTLEERKCCNLSLT